MSNNNRFAGSLYFMAVPIFLVAGFELLQLAWNIITYPTLQDGKILTFALIAVIIIVAFFVILPLWLYNLIKEKFSQLKN
ncbi:MAG: hypothetical protein ABH821_00410 [archaeon]